MKKKIVSLLLMSLLILTMSGCNGCNKQILDTTYKFNYAIIKLPNGEIVEGEVQSWGDYEGEQLQIKINGITYLCSSFNTVLLYK